MSIKKKIDPRLLSQRDYTPYFLEKEVYGTSISQFPFGKLTVTSGELIAADPLVNLTDRLPFNKKVAPGQYDVVACISHTWEDRYAAVMVKFTEQPAVCWEMAITEKQDVEKLEPGYYFGYPVDAGVGCFCDRTTQELYKTYEAKLAAEISDFNPYDDLFAEKLEKDDEIDWANFVIPESDNQNIILFQSGYGDGFYPCYWGIDAEGEITSIVVDFQTINPKDKA